jgi:mono/diheme cytochrome c family protein
MKGRTHRKAAVAAVLTLAAAGCFAEAPGQAIYTLKCQMCHGATGMADSPAGKAMKVKPVTDPDVKKFTEEQMIVATRDGSGKMKPFKGTLTDAQIKDAVGYFRTFLK